MYFSLISNRFSFTIFSLAVLKLCSKNLSENNKTLNTKINEILNNISLYHSVGHILFKLHQLTIYGNQLWRKMVSIYGNWYPLKGDGFPLHSGEFPLQGNFEQNLKSCFQPKI